MNIRKINITPAKLNLFFNGTTIIVWLGFAFYHIFFNKEKVSPVAFGFTCLLVGIFWTIAAINQKLLESSNALVKELIAFCETANEDKKNLLRFLEFLGIQRPSGLPKDKTMVN